MDDPRNEFLIAVAVALPFLFWGIGSISFLEPNEGMYGSIAREMAEGGDWITPHFNHIPYLHKPPLYFWLTSLTFYLSGPSEGAVRLWSALPALGTVILTWQLGRMLYGAHAGFLSALAMVSSIGVFRYARVAAADFLLVFSLTLALYGFVRYYLAVAAGDGTLGPRGALIFYLGMALGVLSKGLMGVVFPLLIVGLFILVNSKQRTVIGRGELFAVYRSLFTNAPGILLFLALVLPWHVLVALRNPGFFNFYVLDNQLLRFLSPRALTGDEISVSTIGFLILTLLWFFPWSLFLPAALRYGFPFALRFAHGAERLRLLVGLWALTVLGFFSLASYKLEHYFLPAVPALSLLVGALWTQAFAAGERSTIQRGALSLKWCLGIGTLGSFLVGLGALFLGDLLTPQALLAGLGELNVYYRILREQGAALPFASVSPFVGVLKELGAVLIIGLPLSFIFFHFRMPKASYVTVLCAAGAMALLVFRLLVIMEPHHSVQSVSLALNTRANPGDVVVHVGPLEYSGGIPFYTGKKVYVLNGNTGTLDFGSRYPEAAHLFLDDDRFADLWSSSKRVFLVGRFPGDGLEGVGGEKPFLVGRYGSRWLSANRPAAGGTP